MEEDKTERLKMQLRGMIFIFRDLLNRLKCTEVSVDQKKKRKINCCTALIEFDKSISEFL